jgi:hypothetical protein
MEAGIAIGVGETFYFFLFSFIIREKLSSFSSPFQSQATISNKNVGERRENIIDIYTYILHSDQR